MKLRDIYLIVAILLGGIVYCWPFVIVKLLYPDINVNIDTAWKYWTLIYDTPMEDLAGYWVRTYGAFSWVDQVKIWTIRVSPLLLGITCFFYMMYSYRTREKQMHDARVTASWATMKDIREFLGKDGVILTKSIRLHEDECYEHVMVVGPTGSGKTASYFLPNILKLLPHQSAVIFDPKGEIYLNTSRFHESQGRDVKLLKLDDHMVSCCWNPLDVPKDMVQMAKLCKSVIKNKSGDGNAGGGGDQDFWDATAEDLLMALVYVAKSIPPGTFGNFRNIYQLLAELSFEAMIGLANFAVADSAAKGQDIRDLLSRTKSFSADVAPEDTRNSSRFVLKTTLNAFQIDTVSFITSTTDLRFECLKERPTALFISMPEHKVDGVKVVLATMYMQLFDSLLDYASVGSDVDPKIKKRPVFFFLDEFANCGKILGFTNYIATIRSRQLSVSVCLQSPEQLKQSYTDSESQAIKNNLKTVLVLPGLKEDSSLKYLSEISGKVAYSERENMNSETRVLEKDRLPMACIRELADDRSRGVHEAIVILKNKPPIKDLQKRYYQDPELTAILKEYPPMKFRENPPEKFEKVRARSFLEPGDIHLLEIIGTFVNFHGKLDSLPSDKKTEILEKFAEFSSLAGLPSVKELDGELMLTWPKAKDARGKLCQIMITTAFKWMFKEKIYTLAA